MHYSDTILINIAYDLNVFISNLSKKLTLRVLIIVFCSFFFRMSHYALRLSYHPNTKNQIFIILVLYPFGWYE